MQVILLERVERLGQMGDVVDVKPGYARNFLFPNSKALRATNENKDYFKNQKKVLEAENLKHKTEAEKIAKKLEGLIVALVRQASEAGSLYGSVTSRDIAEIVSEAGFKVNRTQVKLDRTYKLLGLFPVNIYLHPEVSAEVTVNIARSVEEAKIQEERGEALIATDDIAQEAEERAKKNAAAAAKSFKKKPKAESEEEAKEDAKAEEVIASAEEATTEETTEA